ncbi:MAG TPA: Crp/Fnr family transcriptional regulator [Lacipirellulaceae bacterium]|jgi:CRP-like cAMP-binding protein|nr:Crp/Fnr family transcriptional regulator [Lacipirellulaceae bacterium]
MAKLPQPQNDSPNILLSKLPREQFESLRPSLQLIDLEPPDVVFEANQSLRHAYFPESGMISVVSVMEDGRTIEVGTIGREGVAGGTLLMDVDQVPYRYFTQLRGQAQRIDATRLKETANRWPELRTLILRYEAAFMTQSMQGAACNGLHTVQQRCCRWLLMARDRCDNDEISLTHEFLAMMLGVRRASVSEVLRPLQETGLVSSNRGLITILNRAGIEAGTCECYRIIADQQRRLLGA